MPKVRKSTRKHTVAHIDANEATTNPKRTVPVTLKKRSKVSYHDPFEYRTWDDKRVSYDHLPIFTIHDDPLKANLGTLIDRVGWVLTHPKLSVEAFKRMWPNEEVWNASFQYRAMSELMFKVSDLLQYVEKSSAPESEKFRAKGLALDACYEIDSLTTRLIPILTHPQVTQALSDLLPRPCAHLHDAPTEPTPGPARDDNIPTRPTWDTDGKPIMVPTIEGPVWLNEEELTEYRRTLDNNWGKSYNAPFPGLYNGHTTDEGMRRWYDPTEEEKRLNRLSWEIEGQEGTSDDAHINAIIEACTADLQDNNLAPIPELDTDQSTASERPSTPAPITPIDVDLLYPPTPPYDGEFDIDDWVAVDEYDNPIEETDNYSTLADRDDNSVPNTIPEELLPLDDFEVVSIDDVPFPPMYDEEDPTDITFLNARSYADKADLISLTHATNTLPTTMSDKRVGGEYQEMRLFVDTPFDEYIVVWKKDWDAVEAYNGGRDLKTYKALPHITTSYLQSTVRLRYPLASDEDVLKCARIIEDTLCTYADVPCSVISRNGMANKVLYRDACKYNKTERDIIGAAFLGKAPGWVIEFVIETYFRCGGKVHSPLVPDKLIVGILSADRRIVKVGTT